MAVLNPYLNFPGTARAAMELYQMVLGGELTVGTFGDAGSQDEHADLVMHAGLVTPSGFVLYASDKVPGQPSAFGENGHIALSGDEGPELKAYWDRFAEAEGTEIVQPLVDTPWGSAFGMLRDPHGVLWLFDISGGLPQQDPLAAEGDDDAATPPSDPRDVTATASQAPTATHSTVQP